VVFELSGAAASASAAVADIAAGCWLPAARCLSPVACCLLLPFLWLVWLHVVQQQQQQKWNLFALE